ncbi:response regulator transcription factor [Desulfosporosinus meridiei]|uniref:Stage 0 sporulation protein A homolog n=1 Tax=Desulfosporosinus meridiei (strain ATCC BAA-275 / DSM 13257 / KCTC 12902 / NCIMB 13706 / S10) TaxID=768704 RepID=J7J1J6_DESMD|nr:response regulator transcription factor [Desulfosporosinus meridiei]AFQ46234.1 response regulator with CheY-like receiver domain and winged-helix DNA-binding domain [Desulfosporosinus meridiei DSM 13257]
MAHILIVEDEKAINDLIAMNLELVGHTSQQALAGDEALEYINKHTYSLIIMDIMLPGLDGFDLMKHVPERTPVIFLTAMGNLADRVKGFKLGADDYIVKPFETIELLARIEAVLRRTHQELNVFTLDNTVVNLASRTVTVEGREIELALQEYELLEILIKNKNIALSREKLLKMAWNYDYLGETRTVDVHIQKLRKKLNWENRIKTVYKLGYRLEVDS